MARRGRESGEELAKAGEVSAVLIDVVEFIIEQGPGRKIDK